MADTQKLITWTRVNGTGGFDTLYPKTVASQVIIDQNTTVADHVADTDLHLSSAERAALTATNNANGYVTLDSNGFIPTSKLNPAALAVKLEVANINGTGDPATGGLLQLTTAEVFPGQLVMVLDASDDPTVASGWAIYRRLANASDLSTLSAWQKVAEAESLDVTVTWDNISGKPNSTPAAIDQAVAHDHTHENKTVLDALTDTGTAQAPVLKYGAKTVAFTENVVDFYMVDSNSVPAASTLKEGDFVLVYPAE